MSLLKKLLGKDKLSKYELEQKKRYKQYVKLGTTSTIVLSKTESEIYQDYFVRKMSTRRSRRKIAAPKKPETEIDIFKEPSTNTLSAAPAVYDAINKNVAINSIPEEYLTDLKQFEVFKVEEDVPSAIIRSQQQTHETNNDCQTNTVNTKPLDTKFSYGNQEQFLNKLDEVIRKRSKGESSKVTKSENLQNNIQESRQSFEEENDNDVPIVRPRKKGTKKKQENQSAETMDETDGTRIQVNPEKAEILTQNWQHVTDYYQADDTGKEGNPEKTNTFYEKAEIVTQNWQHVTDNYQVDGTRIQENPEKVNTFPEKAEIVTLNWQQVTDYYRADGTRIQENPEKVDKFPEKAETVTLNWQQVTNYYQADGTRIQENPEKVNTFSEKAEIVTLNWQQVTDYYHADGTRIQENPEKVHTFFEEAEIPTQNWQHGTDNYQSESEEIFWGTPPTNADGSNVTRSNSCITTQSDDSFFDCLSEDDDIYGNGERNIMKQISPHFKDHNDELDSKGFDSEDLFEEEFLNPPKYNTISDEVPIQQMKTDNQEIQHDSLIDQESALLENSMEPDSLEITLNPTPINQTHSEPSENNVNDWSRPIQIKGSDFIFKGDSGEKAHEFVEVQRQNEALFLDENYKPQQTISTFVGDPEFLTIFEKPRSRKNHLIKIENNNDYSDIVTDNGKAEGKKVTFDFGKSYCQRYEADNDPEENELVDFNLLSTLTREEGQVFMPIDNEVYFEIYHNRQNRNKKLKIYPKDEEIPNDDRSQIFLSYGVQLSPTETTKPSKNLGNMDVAFLNCRDGYDIHIPKPTSAIKIVELVDEGESNDHDVQNVNKSSKETNESLANNETNADPIYPKTPLKRPATWGDISNKNGFNNEVQDQNSVFCEKQFDNNNNYNDQKVNESSLKVNESFTNKKEDADTSHTKAKHSTTWKKYALLSENGFNNEQNSEGSNTFKENNDSTNNTKLFKDLSSPLVEGKACKKEDGEDFEETTLNDISQKISQENKSNEFTQPETLIEHNMTNTNDNIYKEKKHPVSNAEDLQPKMEEQVITEKDYDNYTQEPDYASDRNQVNKINFVMQIVRSIESGPTPKENFSIENHKSEQDYHQQDENSQPEGLNYISNTNRKHIEKMDLNIPDQTFHINYLNKLNQAATPENAIACENKLNSRKFDAEGNSHENDDMSSAGSLKRDLQSPLPEEDEIESESPHSPNHFNKHSSFEHYHNNSSYESSKDSQSPKENSVKHESTKYSIETLSPNFPNQTSRNFRQSPTLMKTESFFEDDYEISNSKSPEPVQLLREDEIVKQNIEYSRKPTSPRSPRRDLAVGYSFDLTQNSTSRNRDSIPKTIRNIAQNSNSARTDSEDDTIYSQNFNDFKRTPTSTEGIFFIGGSIRVPNVLEFTVPYEESLNENQRETNPPNYSRDFIQTSVTAKEDAPSEEDKNKHIESFKKDWQFSSPRENKALDEGNRHSMEPVSPNQLFTSKYSRKFFEPSISTEFTTISETKPTFEEHHAPSRHHEEKISLENRDQPKNTIKFAVEDRTSKYFENQGINKSTSPPYENTSMRNKNLRYENATPRNPLSKIFGRSLSHGHVSPNHTYQKPHTNTRSSLDRKLLQQYDEHDMSTVKNHEKDEKGEQTSNEPIENKQYTLQSVKEVQRRLSEVRNIKSVAEQLTVMQDILLNLQRRADVLESKTDDEYVLLLQSLFKSVRIVSGLQCNFDENLLHSQQTTLRDIKACINELNIK